MRILLILGEIMGTLILACLFFLALMYRSEISSDEVIAKYYTPESHFLNVDGQNIHLRIRGEGEPIFLLHGSFASLHTWEVWQKELSPYFMTIALDFPGHGLTGPDELKRYSLEDYSVLVQQIAEKLSISKFHIAGNSMGGAVALEIASNRPDKVLTLALVNAAGAPNRRVRTLDADSIQSEEKSPWIIQMAKNPLISKVLLRCTPKFLFAMNMKEVYGDPKKLRQETVDRYYELMLREGNRQATLDRLSQRRKNEFDFDRINMPTLILWGAKDSWIPVSHASSFQNAIPRANLVVFDEAGHVPMEEIPTESVSEYLSFLGVEVRRNYLEPPKQIVYAD